jgi:hypothetical protein
LETILSFVYAALLLTGGLNNEVKLRRENEMQRKFFDGFLKIAALLIPVYVIFYAPLNDNPANPLIKSLWKYVIAGFIIYAVVIAVVLIS